MARRQTPDILSDVLGNTSKPAKQQNSKTAQSAADLRAQPTDERTKATYYISEDILNDLTIAQGKLRRIVRKAGVNRRALSKSEIVEAAITNALEDLEALGEGSNLVRTLIYQ